MFSSMYMYMLCYFEDSGVYIRTFSMFLRKRYEMCISCSIFHDKGPTKAQLKAAAITIQRFLLYYLEV